MSNFVYYLAWLAVGLVIVAIISALISRHLKQRLMRRLKAAEMLDALGRYSEWVAAQRRTLLFHGGVQEDSAALREARAIGQQWFPDLSAAAAEVVAMHTRLVAFLAEQQALRQQDPEAWLVSDHEARFLEHWRGHLTTVHPMAASLRLISAGGEAGHEPGTPSAA